MSRFRVKVGTLVAGTARVVTPEGPIGQDADHLRRPLPKAHRESPLTGPSPAGGEVQNELFATV